MTGFLAVAAAGGAFGAVVAFDAAIALRDRGVEVTGEVIGVHTAGRTSEVTVTFPDGRGRMVVADVGNYLFDPEPQIGDRPRLIYDPADPEWNVADLDTRRHDFHVAVENWGHDFNIGSVIRTANAFNAKAFHIIGKRRWNRRGAMVTDRYQHENHHSDVAAFVAWARADGGGNGIPLLGVDNVPGSQPIEGFRMPRACVLVFGQEGPGLSDEMQAACEVILHITQFGSTRSINAGAAAAIAMHAWVTQHVAPS